jgi:trk system potassium uptake protein TrkH
VENTGPTPDKLVPRIRETAKTMFLIYLIMSIVLFSFFMLLNFRFMIHLLILFPHLEQAVFQV